MTRVYLDSNIFRFLKNEELRSFRDDLLRYKDRFMYYFSHAHLLDLQRDETEKKYDDLKYMEEFVGTNYLLLEWGEQYTNVLVATPEQAFQSLGEAKPINELLDIDALLDDELFDSYPEMKTAKRIFKSLMSMRIDLGLPDDISDYSEKSGWQKIIPELKGEYTMYEWLNQLTYISHHLFNDPKAYREMRRYIMENLPLAQKYNINIEDINFNESLKDTPLQKSFMDYIRKPSLQGQKQSEQDLFLEAYHSLNILGIDKEPNKKAKFANTFHDAMHAYYAAHCDYLVSDDEGLLLKAKVVYKLLEIETKVIHVRDFSKIVGQIAGFVDTDLHGYLALLRHDLEKGMVVGTQHSLRYHRKYTTIKTSQLHFGFFNRIDCIEDSENGNFVVLYRKVNNYSRFISFKEYEAVTNRVVKMFGADYRFKGEYIDVDTKEIKEHKWSGRDWEFDDIKVSLEINRGNGEFSLVLNI